MIQGGIEDYIPIGRENAISRKRLAKITGLPDRTARKMIEQARYDGVPIINLQDGVGYYITTDPREMVQQIMIDENRQKSLAKTQRARKRWLKAAGML